MNGILFLFFFLFLHFYTFRGFQFDESHVTGFDLCFNFFKILCFNCLKVFEFFFYRTRLIFLACLCCCRCWRFLQPMWSWLVTLILGLNCFSSGLQLPALEFSWCSCFSSTCTEISSIFEHDCFSWSSVWFSPYPSRGSCYKGMLIQYGSFLSLWWLGHVFISIDGDNLLFSIIWL